jgi:CheY-like chemotaxis protein
VTVPAPGASPGTPASVGAAEVLAGLPLQGGSEPALARARLSAVTAAALRAALDLLLEAEPRQRLQIAADDGALEVGLANPDAAGLAAAAAMLEKVDGNLGPARQAGRWAIRVPVASARPIFLMLEQGELRLAVPWTAVVRLRLAATFQAAGRRQDYAVLPPLAPEPAAGSREGEVMAERPAALIGWGARRAWLVADRLVWRMPGEPDTEPALPRIPGLGSQVRAPDGELYRVVDPAALLRGIEPPQALPPRQRPAVPLPLARTTAPATTPPACEPAQPPAEGAAPGVGAPRSGELTGAEQRAGAAPEVARHAVPTPAVAAPLPVLTRERVEPLEPEAPTAGAPSAAAPGPVVSSTASDPAAPASAPEAGAPAAPAAGQASTAPAAPERRLRSALVAEDSITAQIFLRRLLEQRGFQVSAVTSAGALRSELARGGWSIVLADVELPDSTGGAHLGQLGPQPIGAGGPAIVALVRDAEDVSRAQRAGVPHALWKPFVQEDLDGLLVGLGLERA